MLARRVCEELTETVGQAVTVLWERDDDLAEAVRRCGAAFAIRTGDERESLLGAGVREADVIIAVAEDDHLNLQFVLTARDLNGSIRVVLRQFNRTLGRKIEQNLANCSVISLASQSAATYASAAADRTCFYGLQFPDIDGPLVGFFERGAADLGVDGLSLAQAETKLGVRVLACNGDADVARDRLLHKTDALVLFGIVRARLMRSGGAETAAGSRRRAGAFVRAFWRFDPIARRTLLVALVIFVIGAAYFARTLGLDPQTAAYYVFETMTTTGYGDIIPHHEPFSELVAVLLMLSGLTFTGMFIAILTSSYTQARYVAVQGLRQISRRGHIVVCGAGNVGSSVIDYLLGLGAQVVVVEASPRPEIVERSRERHFDLLTGDATKEPTLDLCNVAEAAAVVALTQSDTMNLEVALAARARVAGIPVIMRVQHASFEKSMRRQFGFESTYGTAALAAPVFAGRAFDAGVRGRVTVGERAFGIIEALHGNVVRPPPVERCVPLAVWRRGAVVPLATFDDVLPHDRVLQLYPIRRFARETSRA